MSAAKKGGIEMPWVAGVGMTIMFCLVVYLTAAVCPKCGRIWVACWPEHPAIWHCFACDARGKGRLKTRLAVWWQQLKEKFEAVADLCCGVND